MLACPEPQDVTQMQLPRIKAKGALAVTGVLRARVIFVRLAHDLARP